MLNAATPTLQMKISGVGLSNIQTMLVTIRSSAYVITKGNADIEIDNDVASVFLTQEESEKLNDGFYNISTQTINTNGEDVSDNLKVIWVKRGSMSKALGGGETGDLSDYYTKQEVDILISNVSEGLEGFSPIATVWKENGVTTISIQDENGTTTAQILDGEDGKNGLDGITPHIGENGNWHIGSIDTGIKAHGYDGFSPTIVENPGNASGIYKLDITTEDGTFTTPNLKGKDGEGSGGGSSGNGMFAFEIREDGHLWVISDKQTQIDSFSINEKGHLIYTLEG